MLCTTANAAVIFQPTHAPDTGNRERLTGHAARRETTPRNREAALVRING